MQRNSDEEENTKGLSSCGAHSSSWHRVLVQAAAPSQALGVASITLTGAQPAIPRAPRVCFSSASHRGSSKAAPPARRARTGAEKGNLALAEPLGFCIISSPRLQGSEHKPVQSHCSRSPLAEGRAIELPCSCCSQHRSAAPLQPSGSSSPVPQHTGTRFCLPWLQN